MIDGDNSVTNQSIALKLESNLEGDSNLETFQFRAVTLSGF